MAARSIKAAEEQAAKERALAFDNEGPLPISTMMEMVRNFYPAYKKFNDLDFYFNAVGDRQQAKESLRLALTNGGECAIMRAFLERKLLRHIAESTQGNVDSPVAVETTRAFGDTGMLLKLLHKMKPKE